MRESGHVRAGSRRRAGTDDARRSTRRTLLLALGAGALAAPLLSFAQTKVPRVGILGNMSASDPLLESFAQGLRELGYVEGKTSSSSAASRKATLRVSMRWPPNLSGKSPM